MPSVRLLPGFRVLCSAAVLSLLPLALLIAGPSLTGDASAPDTASLAGSFQSELGCPGDWQPDCLRSRLRDPDGDGVYALAATLPPGTYEAEVVIDGSWREGQRGREKAASRRVPFTVAHSGDEVHFRWDRNTRSLDITITLPGPLTGTSRPTARAGEPEASPERYPR